MELKQLEYFMVLCRELNFTRGSRGFLSRMFRLLCVVGRIRLRVQPGRMFGSSRGDAARRDEMSDFPNCTCFNFTEGDKLCKRNIH